MYSLRALWAQLQLYPRTDFSSHLNQSSNIALSFTTWQTLDFLQLSPLPHNCPLLNILGVKISNDVEKEDEKEEGSPT
jgi:hypothetical protein